GPEDPAEEAIEAHHHAVAFPGLQRCRERTYDAPARLSLGVRGRGVEERMQVGLFGNPHGLGEAHLFPVVITLETRDLQDIAIVPEALLFGPRFAKERKFHERQPILCWAARLADRLGELRQAGALLLRQLPVAIGKNRELVLRGHASPRARVMR